jgi:NAD(P)H-hydrate epimerase
MKIVTQEEMRGLEEAAVKAGVSLDTLMENAGLAVARWIADHLGYLPSRRVLTLVGPGNNGGDGLCAARHLSRWGATVVCYLCVGRPDRDPKRDLAAADGVQFVDAAEDPQFARLRTLALNSHLVLDAILGTGRARALIPPVSDEIRVVLGAARVHRPLVVALDLQTGLNANTGDFDANGLPADIVLTLGAPKLGMYLKPLVNPAEAVVTLDIGIPAGEDRDVRVEAMTEESAAALLPLRPIASNKGTYGRALVVGGSKNFVGAAYLAAAAAAASGAGIVTLAAPRSVTEIVASRLAEATYVPLVESEPGAPDPEVAGRQIIQACERVTAMLIGPGLGQTPYIGPMLRRMLAGPLPDIPLIFDADGLNALARVRMWWEQLRRPAAITPHPGEMARLMETTVEAVQDDRLGTARAGAEKFGCVVILKGACTIVAHPDGRARISPWANAALATGGTGDVLAGVVVSLLAQGVAPFDAATLAVYAHGLAGHMASGRTGVASLVAGDVLAELPEAVRRLEARRLRQSWPLL